MRTLFTPSAVAALVAAPMLMFSAPSYSALITQTDSVALSLFIGGELTGGGTSSMDEEYSTVFDFSAFDSSLGTLNAVRIDIDRVQGLNVLVENDGATDVSYNFTADYGHTLGNFSNGSTIETGGFFSQSDSGILSAGANRAVEFGPDALTDTFVLSGLDLMPFIDTDAFDVTTVLFQQTALVLGTPEGGDETGGFGGSTDLNIVMTVEYDYRPLLISIPEPGSMALMVLALAGLRLCGRR